MARSTQTFDGFMKVAVFLIRGMLGAAIGAIVWMFLPAIFMGALKDPGGLGLLIFWYVRLIVWLTAALGAIIALTILIVYSFTGNQMPITIRVPIAIVIACIPMALLVFANGEPLSFFKLWYPWFFGLTVGGIAGLFMGSPKHLIPSGNAVEQIVGREPR